VKLYCASGNPGKLREFALAARPGVEIEPLAGVPPCEENGRTFEENAVAKAIYYSRHAPGLLFADDSGLEVDALGGAPGIYSARYAGDDRGNNERVLREMEGVENRAARFVCVIALAKAGGLLQTFRAEVEGEILKAPRGEGGFGYDPLFYYPPFECSLAEAPTDEKFEISHRGQALAMMMNYIVYTT
jgi:XTP/dITP diphosphohydrolase